MNRNFGLAAVFSLLVVAGLAGWQPAEGQGKAARQPSAAAVLAYRDAANLQNNGAFDVAAEEWQSFLKTYPDDPLAAKARHYLGVCQHELKQLEAAVGTFEAVLKNYPQFELREDAYFRLGLSRYALAGGGQRELYARAAEAFAALVKEFPQSKYADEALYYQGEALYAQGQKTEALVPYERLAKDFPKSKRRADGLYALGVAQEELGRLVDAGRTYDLFLAEFAKSDLASEVKMRKAEVLLAQGEARAAERLFGEVAAIKGFAAADHALYQRAYCLAKLGQDADAAAAYGRLADDFPQSSYAAEATIAAGRLYYKLEKWDEAKARLEQAIDRHNANSPEAAHWLCRLLIRNGQAGEAAELAATHAGGSGESPYLISLKLDRADALYEMADRREEALAEYARFAAEHPRHELAPQALYNAAYTAQELKRYEEALHHAARFLAGYPQDRLAPDVQYVAAECHLLRTEYDEAEKLYRELVARHGGHAAADAWRVRLGLVAFQQKKYDAAIEALTPVAAELQSPDARAEAWYLLGASHFSREQPAEAAAALAASLKANPRWRQADDAMLLLARGQAKLGRRAEAQANLEKLLADFPASHVLDQAHYQLAEMAYAADDFPAAIEKYDLVVSRFSDSRLAPHALYGKGWAQLKSKDFAAGAASFTALLAQFPEHSLKADALLGRAMCRRQAGDAAGALADLDLYLKSNPDAEHRNEALFERGLAQMAAGSFPAAAATFEALVMDDARFAAADKAQYQLGWALRSQNKMAQAAAEFARLAKEHPDSPLAAEAWLHVGEHHYDQKQFADAADAYAAVTARSPGGTIGEQALHKLGWSHYQLQAYDKALAQFENQLAAFPAGPLAADALFMKAECLFKQQNYERALPAYQSALAVKASTPLIESLLLLHGGQTAAQLKRWDDSIQLLSQLAQQQQESPLLAEALYERGWARQNLGQTVEAQTDYEAAATRSRDHVGARARFMLGELLFSQKKHDQAVREFQRAMYGYGGDQASAETKNWQAKSGFEAGRCAEVLLSGAADSAARQKNLADARRFYTFVAEKHSGHELAREAKKRLEALSKL
jgi:TolA-binding protein